MWIIKKIWFDTLENRNHTGYDNWAITSDKELVDLLRGRTTSNIIGKGFLDVYQIEEIRELTLEDMDDMFVAALQAERARNE